MQSNAAAPTIDPLRFEVMRHAFIFVTETMTVSLRRSAFSTNIKTRGDFSCAFFDRKVRTIAQSFAQPSHLGSLARLVPWAIAEYGVDRLGPGDGLLVNDPFHGGGHLNDLTLISPVYDGNDLIGFVANLAHHVDVGGGAPASIGAFQEIFQEGVQVPPVKLVEAGHIVPDVFNLLLAQIRAKREMPGDLRAQIAANNTGVRQIGELFQRYGREQALAYGDELIAYTERRVRAAIAKLPKGRCGAIGFMDDDGFSEEPIRLQVEVEIGDDTITFDLAGSADQRRGPANATYAQTFAACAYALGCLVDPDIPVNDGFYRALIVHAPAGTVVNAVHPAPVVAGWEVSARIGDTIFKALSELMPRRVPAGTKGMVCHAGFGGLDPIRHEYYCFLETVCGGYGGRFGKDGPDAVQMHGQNTENSPVEETEYNYPVRILEYALIPDSDGAGRWRGGLGVRRDYMFLDHRASFTILADRTKQRPWGLFGGDAAQAAEYVLNPAGEARRLRSKITVQLEPGDVISYRTCGGGGYEPAKQRDAARVVEDVRNGKLSLERARAIYGVAVDSRTWTHDPAATASLRAAL